MPKQPNKGHWWRRGAVLALLFALLIFAAWAPVPPPWQFDLQIGLIFTVYCLIAVVSWRATAQRPGLRKVKPASTRRGAVPLTPVQQHYLDALHRLEPEEEHPRDGSMSHPEM